MSLVSMSLGAKSRIRPIAALVIVAAVFAVLIWIQPSGLYPWFKALHIIAIISWMAGMLYLPRLFIYHCAAKPGSEQSETFKVMERRLLTIIINPAMVASWVLGLWLAFDGKLYLSDWFHAKFALVLAMSAIHGLFVRWVREFSLDKNQHDQKFYRIINEVPTLLMIGIVILAVVKPF